MQENMQLWLPEVRNIVEQAGKKILEIYHSDYTIKNKNDNTPVTTADLLANEFIVQQLSLLAPDIPILSEESDDIPFAQRCLWETYWLVDPLDGTREFIAKTGGFSVNIALIHQHRPIMGVIYSPIKQQTYYATQDKGAFYLKTGEAVQKIQACTQYPGTSIRKLVIAGTHSARSIELQKFFASLEHHFDSFEMIYQGSSIKSCMVASGQADLYARLGPTSEWDTAAAQCIVEEAGGQITDTQMQALRYNTKESLLNPNFFVFGDSHIDWQKFLAN